MRKTRKQDGHESLDRWLLTYADMITLLMAFFIMMYSMSVLNLSKFKAAAVSIRSGFGGQSGGQGKSILKGGRNADGSGADGSALGLRSKVFEPLVSYIQNELGKGSGVGIREDERGIVITLSSDQVLFDSGSADIKEQAYPVLDKIAETLDRIVNPVRVEGHTCNLPPRGSQFPSNWELSTARATNVLRYMVEKKGLDPARLAAAGYGSVKPIKINIDEASRRLNRRVEIVVLRSVAAEPKTSANAPREEIRRSGRW